MLALVIAAALAFAGAISPVPVHAVDYNNTNPFLTPCGDGSHTMIVMRNFYIKSGGLAYARVELRWSPFCNTVWARAINVTGSGAGYATARSLTSDETIKVYNCPRFTCQVHTETETGDVLPSNGSTGFSFQFVIPANGSIGSPAAVQPPTLRGIISIHTGGHTYSLDTNLEPIWTWFANGFKNERNLRDGSIVMSCTNSPDRCVTRAAFVTYELDSSLSTTTGTSDLIADMQTTILPAWSHVTTNSPFLGWCLAPCSEDVLVKAVPAGDPDLGGAFGVTVYDGGFTSGTPAQYLHQTMKIKNTFYDHSCPQGCTGTHPDDRPVIGHEMGHTLGLEHCDTSNVSVMCAAQSTLATELDFTGPHYWAPRATDLKAFSAFYP